MSDQKEQHMNIEEKPTGALPISGITDISPAKKPGVELAIFCGLSVLSFVILDIIGVMIFFAIQQIYLRLRGRKAFFTLFAISAVSIFCYMGFIDPLVSRIFSGTQDFAEIARLKKMFVPFEMLTNIWLVTLVLGFLFLNLYENPKMRFLYKLLAVSGVSCIIGVVSALYFQANADFVRDYNAAMVYLAEPVLKAFNVDKAALNLDNAMISSWIICFSSGVFAILALSSWTGLVVAKRYFKLDALQLYLVRFSIPDVSVWVLIAILCSILIGFVVDTGFVGIVAYNLLFIVSSVFTIQGMGIAGHFMTRSPFFSQVARFVPLIMIVLFLSAWFLLPLFWIFLAGLGVSDVWLHYRTMVERKPDSE
jgi:hypothetical protein